MTLSKDNAASIIIAHDSAFSGLLALQRWPSPYPQTTQVYTATYNTTEESASPRTLVIETGSRAALETGAALISLVAAHTTPGTCPRVLTLDHSTTVIPSSYALLSLSAPPPGSPAEISGDPEPLERALPAMSERMRALTELRLGAHLRALHALENDWFGVPGAQDEWGECYSWQEAFSLLVETALEELGKLDLDALGPRKVQEEAGVDGKDKEVEEEIPVEDLRRALGRAIGFYLFDDVEVPSLVWCGALEWSSFAYVHNIIELDSAVGVGANAEGRTPILPEPPMLAHWGGPLCLWGDPLMEGALRAPSAALCEGYRGNSGADGSGEVEGSGLIVFARQRTKRLWYTAYAALCTLLGASRDAKDAVETGDTDDLEEARKRYRAARTLLSATARELKDAPCY
ncbi:hypothetical protein M0805_003985 [Coniferiporia weirii]|nr:hypothetical protein M0805_003985 [Coniferiporia weirii]